MATEHSVPSSNNVNRAAVEGRTLFFLFARHGLSVGYAEERGSETLVTDEDAQVSSLPTLRALVHIFWEGQIYDWNIPMFELHLETPDP